MMSVSDLIELLKSLPPELPVVYRCHSEQVELLPHEIEVGECCLPRADGWVHDARPDKPKQTYLILPGN